MAHQGTINKHRKLEHYFQRRFGGGGGAADLINLGNTLIVSKTGNDAAATVENLNNHYLTISAALADAQNGDIVWIFPGQYAEDLTISVAGNIGLFLHPETTIQGDITVIVGTIASIVGGKVDGDGLSVTVNQQAGSELSMRNVKVVSQGSSLSLNDTIELIDCYIDDAQTGGAGVSITQQATTATSYIRGCTFKSNSPSDSILFSGNASAGKLVFVDNITNKQFPYDAQLHQSFNIEGITL